MSNLIGKVLSWLHAIPAILGPMFLSKEQAVAGVCRGAYDTCFSQGGGMVGDWAAAKSPKHGRVFAAQFSVGIGVPLAMVIYKVSAGSCD